MRPHSHQWKDRGLKKTYENFPTVRKFVDLNDRFVCGECFISGDNLIEFINVQSPVSIVCVVRVAMQFQSFFQAFALDGIVGVSNIG